MEGTIDGTVSAKRAATTIVRTTPRLLAWRPVLIVFAIEFWPLMVILTSAAPVCAAPPLLVFGHHLYVGSLAIVVRGARSQSAPSRCHSQVVQGACAHDTCDSRNGRNSGEKRQDPHPDLPHPELFCALLLVGAPSIANVVVTPRNFIPPPALAYISPIRLRGSEVVFLETKVAGGFGACVREPEARR